ncbi:MAG: CDP-glycerol glycerophosphotransferase family protein [Candidatus Andersenbacteria bacterium]
MKLLFSVPTGYHLRELLMPLKEHLEADSAIEQVIVMTPGARYRTEIFALYPEKFVFIENPAIENIEAHKTLLQEHHPDIVITDTVGIDFLDYPVLKAAQELRLKTLTFIASWDNVWKINRHMQAGKNVAFADSFIVWNEMMKEHLLSIVSPVLGEQVAVIGAPRLDYFWHEDRIPTKQALYEYLGLTDTSRPLIHFSTTELYPMGYLVKAIREGITKGEIPRNPYLYASVHPGGNMDNHKDLKQYDVTVRYSFGRRDNAPMKEFAYNITPDEQYMLTAVFKHADLLINHSSSTALESLIAKTPVINVKYGQPLDWWRWYRSSVYSDFKEHYLDIVKYNATRVVHNNKQLVSATKELLENPVIDEGARAKTVQRMISTVDGTTGQRVLNRIKQLV